MWWKRNKTRAPLIAAGFAFLWVIWLVLSHAWFTDDAYFSFRSVDNFINGYGLTWNVTERVQGYTHPLWVLLLSLFYFFTHEIYLTTIVVSLALTLAVTWLIIFRFDKNHWRGLAAILLLTLSTAFIDYSTSGLENPLSHLLLGIFLLLFLRKQRNPRSLFWMAFVAALAAVNRLDTVLFYAPALAYEWWLQKDRLPAVGTIALGFAPLIAWEIFSIVYYGFPFPNTYYAKAQNYVELGQEVWAGLNYFLFTLKFDPLTWAVIVAAFVTTIWQRHKKALVIVIGMLLYLLYILQIGGDFMGGRFLSAVYLAAVVLLLVYLFPKLRAKQAWGGLVAVVVLSLLASSPPYFLYAKNFQTARWNGAVDERMIYIHTNFLRVDDLYEFNSNPQYNFLNRAAYFARSLWRGTLFRFEAEHDWVDLGRELRAQAEKEGQLTLPQGANGFTGYYVGPQVYLVHGLALTDGLLARVPPIYNPNWRSGHFMRRIPPGYVEVEAGTQAHLDDAGLDAYYQQIRLVTHGPLFTAARWQAIWNLNTHDFDALLPGYSDYFRFPGLQVVHLHGLPATDMVDINFGGQGSAAQVEFGQTAHANEISLRASADNFELFFLDAEGAELGSIRLLTSHETDIEEFVVQVPKKIAEQGYAAVRLVPIRVLSIEADGAYNFYSLRADN